MTKDVIELAREAGFGMQMALLDDPFAQSHAQRLYQQLSKFAALVAARERERIANLVLTTDAWRNAGWVSTICPTTKQAIAAATNSPLTTSCRR